MMAKHAGHGSLIVKRKCAAVNEDEPVPRKTNQLSIYKIVDMY